MKKIYAIALSTILSVGITSCDFDTENYQDIPTDAAYESVQDIQNGMNGAYYALGTYRFCGNYAIAVGDMCAGVSNGSPSSGHFYYVSNYIVDETTSETTDIWDYGFKVIDRATRTIQGADKVIANAEKLHLSEKEIAYIDLYAGQCHALRALANYYLVNLFALPYAAGRDNLGLPLVKDKPIEAFQKIERSTVGATYDFIMEDLTDAVKRLDAAAAKKVTEKSAFYMGYMGIAALSARVNMDMGKYAEAEAAAKQALTLKGKGDGTGADNLPADEIYLSMWSSLAESDEDIFTIVKNESDNLSANSLNTLYGSYYGYITSVALELFGENDIRTNLLRPNSDTGDIQPAKFDGISTSAATSNIPIFRKSEMSLIIAEAEARVGTISEAQKYLFYTAKRNKDLTAAEQLPSTKDELLIFISEERIREFFGEGHRFYDARRMKDLVTSDTYEDFDIAKFVFPIPADEINAGFCTQQNVGWEDALPE